MPTLKQIIFVLLGLTSLAWSVEPCRIQVIDQQNGWPVPLVSLTTTHHVRLVTDNAGNACFDLPELMGQPTWLTVQGHGYSVPKDGFGYAGVKVTPQPGETITIQVQRQLPAKRLGRITGAGLFAETQKLNLDLNWRDQGILGCDSVQNAVYQDRLFWVWGDTTLSHHPLGRFHSIAAATSLRPSDTWQPPLRLRYHYVTDKSGIARNVARMPGTGPTWLSGLATVTDEANRERLVATYTKIRPPLTPYEIGLCVWNDETLSFEKSAVLWTYSDTSPEPPPHPDGHAVRWTDDAGQSWLLFGDPFPFLRCAPTWQALQNPDAWKVLEPQKSVPSQEKNATVKPHRGSIAWSDYRRKWVAIFTQLGGDRSHLGEIWYSEAGSPVGPWSHAVHVVTHDKQTFYNPVIHREFTSSDSPILLFEGTYTKTFSQAPSPTPRYEYNQILYRLDLDELSAKKPE